MTRQEDLERAKRKENVLAWFTNCSLILMFALLGLYLIKA
jgi:hypothetical protein